MSTSVQSTRKIGDTVHVKVWVGGTTDAHHTEVFITTITSLMSETSSTCRVDVSDSKLIQASTCNKDTWGVSLTKRKPKSNCGYVMSSHDVTSSDVTSSHDPYANGEDGITNGPSGLMWL